ACLEVVAPALGVFFRVWNRARPPIWRWLQELRWLTSIGGALSLWRLQYSSLAATQVGRLSPAIANIATRSPFLGEMCGTKRKRITGVTKSFLRKTKGCCFTCKRHASSNRSVQSLNGTTEISTRWWPQRKRRGC